MVFLNNEKIIFLKARKVAGTSFEIALSRYAKAEDIITPISPNDERLREELGFASCQNYLDQNGAQMFKNHISASEAKKKLGCTIWNEVEKCSIVRNPFDVYISLFYYQNGSAADISKLTEWYFDGKGSSYLGINHQQYFVKDKMIIDRFVRYENFEEDIQELEGAVPALKGLYSIFSNIKAKSGIRSNASYDLDAIYYNHPELKDRIRSLHSFEIAKFGYHAL